MKNYHAIGLMSGTSLDGLDICYTEFIKHSKWDFKIHHSETIAYSTNWNKQLKDAIHLKNEDLLALHVNYGLYLGEQIKKFRTKHNINNIDVIASHGHTVFHQPERRFTLQIGDGRAIKQLNHYPIVYDFRSEDVIDGGNGAPLVPIGDHYLFNEYQACLNLGGFSNISFIQNNQRIAFDICPVNIVLNHYAQKLNLDYDKGGEIARNGEINIKVLSELNRLEFYQKIPPKSLGIEWVIMHIFPLLDSLTPENAIATYTYHITKQIDIIFRKYNIKNCLITGGGAYNTFLMDQLKQTSNTELIIPENGIIDFKEALIFAFMGVLRIENQNNILSSATGSKKDKCSGLLI